MHRSIERKKCKRLRDDETEESIKKVYKVKFCNSLHASQCIKPSVPEGCYRIDNDKGLQPPSTGAEVDYEGVYIIMGVPSFWPRGGKANRHIGNIQFPWGPAAPPRYARVYHDNATVARCLRVMLVPISVVRASINTSIVSGRAADKSRLRSCQGSSRPLHAERRERVLGTPLTLLFARIIFNTLCCILIHVRFYFGRTLDTTPSRSIATTEYLQYYYASVL
ncbi:hypothetical protein EVAR_26758_1 [Eumeta japonica]|uniref:Uncharacterized protein n=1 Tax=Eumeta variegata TaxID=151549 RepID=A0A4C1XCP9_EUMVA|nr:hypothetical protein EVAR_26758_1 [Eumeta japonica]